MLRILYHPQRITGQTFILISIIWNCVRNLIPFSRVNQTQNKLELKYPTPILIAIPCVSNGVRFWRYKCIGIIYNFEMIMNWFEFNLRCLHFHYIPRLLFFFLSFHGLLYLLSGKGCSKPPGFSQFPCLMIRKISKLNINKKKNWRKKEEELIERFYVLRAITFAHHILLTFERNMIGKIADRIWVIKLSNFTLFLSLWTKCYGKNMK